MPLLSGLVWPTEFATVGLSRENTEYPEFFAPTAGQTGPTE